ncbi:MULTISPECIES: oligosaccharide flippase family protein [Caproicibacterium]|uniref:Oligosaccharide flippase family protein n=1 Tax=Caproicibacterium argilliputei TaxID=3030016 RepID=A0AA97H2T3_9FIRM|nr:polysaccharide biosynthesis C-terminal domain-containing protein [Caproicibacterium argilliputei]WOC32567.1 oligosaccharide flippase family protein [Caproicibacterium argilliputei]
MNKRAFIRNTFWLTLESTAVRLSGIWFKGWVCDALGSVQMGIYQLVFSVFSLGVVLSASGANFAATRLTAERGPNRQTLRRCLLLSLAVSAAAGAGLYFCAPLLAGTLGGTTPLRVLIPGLPCIAAAATLKGCFVAEGHTGSPMAAELLEQAVGIALSIFLVRQMQNPLTALMLASTLSEGCSCLFMVLAYLRRYVRHVAPETQPPAPWKEAVRIGGPVIGGTGLRSLLFSVENLLIPRGLAVRAGNTAALSQYGLVQGMVLPMLLFPNAILSAAITLLVPELARCCADRRKVRIQLVAGRAFRLTLCFSFSAAAFIAAFAAPLCRIFYGSTDGAFLLRIMAPLMPLMYVDSVVDGMLKGLDQQSYSLFYNIVDACMRVTWCAFVLPHLGLMGYILLLFLSEIFNAALSISRLLKVAEVEISPVWVFLPACGAVVLYALFTQFLPY